jgi:copper chaperone
VKQNFEVLNVKCGGCGHTLITSLEKEFGTVEVNLEVEPRVITLDVEEGNIPRLRVELKKLGYPMSDEDLSKFDAFSTNAKSYISCAIGKINN